MEEGPAVRPGGPGTSTVPVPPRVSSRRDAQQAPAEQSLPKEPPPDPPLRPASPPGSLAHELTATLSGLMGDSGLAAIQDHQANILGRLQVSEARLAAFNATSSEKHAALAAKFGTYTSQIQTLKTELDGIFERIRRLRGTVKGRYPAQYVEAGGMEIERIENED